MLEKSIPTSPLDWVAPVKRVRKNRSIEEKRKIVLQSLSPANSIAAVARTHNINPNLLHTWRWQYRRGELGEHHSGAALLPVRIEPQASASVNLASTALEATLSHVEIIVGDARVLVHGSVEREVIHSVLQALQR